MNESPAPDVLIRVRDPHQARRWADVLQRAGYRILAGGAGHFGLFRPDLVLADGGPWQPSGPLAEAGIVRVGGPGPGDVVLPADVTDRELLLACKLLAEIVRLRRREKGRVQVERRLAEAATTDPLTGLPNRRAWDAALAERLAGSTGSSRLCLAILDLDHFKRVNDTHGHLAGDEALRRTGNVLETGLRAEDVVARLGGDEFGLLLDVPEAATAIRVVERARCSLPDHLSAVATPTITASVGLALSPDPRRPTCLPCGDALFDAADSALREAKGSGRNRTVAHAAP